MKKPGNLLYGLFDRWWFRHLLFWIIIWNYFAWGNGFILVTPPQAYMISLGLVTSAIFVVYPLLYFLIPEFLVKRKFLLFFLGYFILITTAAILRQYMQQLTGLTLTPTGFVSKIGNNVLPYTYICCIAASVKLLRHAYFQAENAEAAIKDKTLAELELLKTQIHPHFLFNTLNSLYAHTRQNSDKSPGIILTLSDLLRFMIYESKAEFIPLTEEIILIKNYVELERFRYGDEVDISLSFSGDLEGKLIRPLLLLPLLENCFKHGTAEELDQKWITLDLNQEKDLMYLSLSNSRNTENTKWHIPAETKGVSLQNVKRRIELYYPGKHTLMIKDDGEIFLIKLDLKLVDDKALPGKVKNAETIKYDLEMPLG